jgi:hypothetical protein
MMGGAFIVAATGVAALGWWVLRGDGINRQAEAPGAEQEPPPQGLGEEHT